MILTPEQLSLEKAIRERIVERRAAIARLRLEIHDPKAFDPLRQSDGHLDVAEQMLSSIATAVDSEDADRYLSGAQKMLEVELLNTSQYAEIFERGGAADHEGI
jgi:hypothetical protein